MSVQTSHQAAGLFATLLLTCLVSACASTPPQLPPVSANSVRGKGYESAQSLQKKSVHESWEHGDDRINLTLHVPVLPGHFPLIIYLAGLGESADNAESLHTEWTQAGYAVLSLQSAQSGPAAFSGARDRNSDIRALVVKAYSPTQLQQRLQELDWVMQELRQRQSLPSPNGDAFNQIDLQKILIAGFDLGAQTAQAIGGEAWPNIQVPESLHAIKGLILLSPHADFGGESFDTRYRNMHVPTLAVSSPEDIDAFDFITNVSLRRQPFEHMPAGDKYFLELTYASHAVIGGGTNHTIRADANNKKGPDDSGGSRRNGRGPGGGGMSRGDSGMGKPQGRGAENLPQATAQEDQVVILHAVTLAFLDSVLRHDDIAKEWLDRDANRWLGQSGRLFLH